MHPTCHIHPSVRIEVKEGKIGANSVISENVVIEGTKVEIGREAFLDSGAYIGGGSSFSRNAYLVAGDWLHMGKNSHINIACGVDIGHSVGVGVDSKVFSHGAYLDSFNLGAPVQWGSVRIGDNVWLPNAWVNPGVTIGSNVVISARTLVNSNVPSGTLFGGIPGVVLRENYLPRNLKPEEKSKLIEDILVQFINRCEYSLDWAVEFLQPSILLVNHEGKSTEIDLENLTIRGSEFVATSSLKDQLRRNGIRFRFSYENGSWGPW